MNDVKVLIAAAGGIVAVIRGMVRCEDHAGVQQYGCAALAELAFNNEENRVAIAAAGGIAVVAGAMANHADNYGVQESAAKAIERVVRNIPDHIAVVRVAGMVPLLQHAADMGIERAKNQLQRMGM